MPLLQRAKALGTRPVLGEKVTTEISKQEKPAGMPENKKVAKRGGRVAGNARKETEKELKKSVTSSENYLTLENALEEKN